MRRYGFSLLLFVLVFAGVLVWRAPASLLAGGLERATDGHLTLAQTEGGVWRGAGVLLLRHDNRFLPLGYYAWRVAPTSNLMHWSVELDTGSAAPSRLRVSHLQSEVEIAQAHVLLPAQLLSVFAPQLLPYRLSGELVLSSDQFKISHGSHTGRVTLDWRQASSGLTDIAPLGDYRIVLQGSGADLGVDLSTVTGKLQLAGSGQIQPGRALTFNGTAQAAADQKENLSELLHHIGPEMSPGVFSFALVSH